MGFKVVLAFCTYIIQRIVESFPFFVFIVLFSLFYVIASWKYSITLRKSKLYKEVNGRHVIVIGASLGLGLATCKRLAASGANLTMISRRENLLTAARDEVSKAKRHSSQSVSTQLSDASDYKSLLSALKKSVLELGEPYWIVCTAGGALPGYMADQLPVSGVTPIAELQIHQNYYTALNVFRALANLYNNKGSKDVAISKYPSRIVLTGSVVSLLSFVGYSAYSARQYALRGLADSLRSEMLAYGVKIHVGMLGNIDTAGFENENKMKPEVTKLIEGKCTLYSADKVASCLLSGVINNRYYICNEIIGEFFRINNHGSYPRECYIGEVLAAPIIAIACRECIRMIDRESKASIQKRKLE